MSCGIGKIVCIHIQLTSAVPAMVEGGCLHLMRMCGKLCNNKRLHADWNNALSVEKWSTLTAETEHV